MSTAEALLQIFDDAYFAIVNLIDRTKRLVFDLTGMATGTTTTITSDAQTDVSLKLPSKSGTIERIEADRVPLVVDTMDYTDSEIRVLNMTHNFTLAITNPLQGKVVLLEVTPNNFTLSFPASVKIISGKFKPTTLNYIYFHCVDGVVPTYVVTIGQQLA